MQDAQVTERIRHMYQSLRPEMDERMRRQWAAAEASALGYGGVTAVADATGLSRTTIAAGLAELGMPAEQRLAEAARVRRPGGGRRPLAETDPGLPAALESLIEPTARGDPESPLRWTCKSTRRLAAELTRLGHPVGRETVASLLHAAGYSLQANAKTREGRGHPDRDAQFRYINGLVKARLGRGRPVISVDTKKKELVGDFRNAGREWRPGGERTGSGGQVSFPAAGPSRHDASLGLRGRCRCAAVLKQDGLRPAVEGSLSHPDRGLRKTRPACSRVGGGTGRLGGERRAGGGRRATGDGGRGGPAPEREPRPERARSSAFIPIHPRFRWLPLTRGARSVAISSRGARRGGGGSRGR